MWRPNLVSACTFPRVCSAYMWRGSLRLRIGEFVSPDQIVFETFRVCKIILHSDPGPITKQPLQPNVAPNSDTIFVVIYMRLTFSSFPVFVLSVRPPLLGSPSECIWPALRGWDRLPRVRLASSTDSRVFLTAYLGFQRSSLFRFRMLRHDTTAALLLTMCSPVLMLKPSEQQSSQFTASFCCDPEVLCGA